MHAKKKNVVFWVMPCVLMLFAASFAASQYKVPTILPALLADLNFSVPEGSWLITSFTLTGTIMALVAGPLADRIGVKKSLLVAWGFMLAGSFVGVAVAHQPILLVLSRCVEGIGFSIVCVAGPLAIERLVSDEHRGVANGIWGVWIPLGAFAGEVLAPIVYSSSLGFGGVWTIFVVPMTIMALVILFVIKNVPPVPSTHDSDGEATGGLLESIKGLGLNYALFMIAWLSFNLLNFAIMSYGPTYLQGVGFDASISGFVTTIPMLLSLLTGPIGGAIIDRTHCPKQMLVLALLVNVLTTVLLFTQRGFLVWVAVVIMGLLATLTFVATLSSVADVIKDKSAYTVAISVYMFVQCGGELLASFVAPVLLGSNLDNWPALTIACGVAGLVGLLSAVFTKYGKREG